jgi:hypothetical protein
VFAAIQIDNSRPVSCDRRGAGAGQIAGAATEQGSDMASGLGFSWWGGQDLNLRPTDYEFDSDTRATCAVGCRRASDQRF